jgi:hypothetical protein
MSITNVLVITKRHGSAQTSSYSPSEFRRNATEFDDELLVDLFASLFYKTKTTYDSRAFLLSSENFERAVLVTEKQARDTVMRFVGLRLARERAENEVLAQSKSRPPSERDSEDNEQ